MSVKNKKWLALFSQTGKEICDISDCLGVYPDCILTDNTQHLDKIDSRLSNSGFTIFDDYRSNSTADRIKYMDTYLSGYDIITLHGWLNIVPGEICRKYKIYNGHPGLITRYPELVGKDPQKRVWENINKYPIIGSVVHEVIEEVDKGKVIVETSTISNKCKSLDNVFDTLRITSMHAWIIFFRNFLDKEND